MASIAGPSGRAPLPARGRLAPACPRASLGARKRRAKPRVSLRMDGLAAAGLELDALGGGVRERVVEGVEGAGVGDDELELLARALVADDEEDAVGAAAPEQGHLDPVGGAMRQLEACD